MMKNNNNSLRVRGKEILAPFRFEWTTNTEVFNIWIKEYLLLDLKEWDVVILDNASFHKSFETIKLIESVWAKVLFLPPYSPDLNPIEQYWAVLKAYVRKFNKSFDTFLQTLDCFLKKLLWWFAS
jgi:transposase